jgi:hypothetical protein
MTSQITTISPKIDPNRMAIDQPLIDSEYQSAYLFGDFDHRLAGWQPT